MTFSKVDLYVDLTYGVLIVIGMLSMFYFQKHLAAVTFGVGVLLGYTVHIGWRMARFDPDTKAKFEETVEQTVEDQVEESVEEQVESMTDAQVEEMEAALEDRVEEQIEELVGEMQDQVEEAVEETVEDAVNDT